MRYIYRDLVFPSYRREVFNASALGPDNMLAVMVIQSSMDQDGNWNKTVCICILLLSWLAIGMYNDIIRFLKHITTSQIRMSYPIESNCLY